MRIKNGTQAGPVELAKQTVFSFSADKKRKIILVLCCAAMLCFTRSNIKGYYSRFQMPYLQELWLRRNHTFIFKYSHFENKHDEHKQRGKWAVKNDSLFLKFDDDKVARYRVSGNELNNGDSEPFKRK